MSKSSRDIAKENISEFNMNQSLWEWQPGLPFGSEKYFNIQAEHDGEEWYYKNLSENTINNFVTLGKEKPEEIKSLCAEIRKSLKLKDNEYNIDEIKDEDFSKILLMEKLIDADYQKAFIIGWNASKRADKSINGNTPKK